MAILDDILAVKRVEVARARVERSLSDLETSAIAAGPTRGLRAALARGRGEAVRVIAEIKRASPSAGAIRAGADPAAIAREYADAGAAAISVLTDQQFFDGALAFLARCRTAVPLPLLRKDFIIDPYQVVEARAAGADGVLLIVAALAPAQLAELLKTAAAYELDALVEVHAPHEAEIALAAGATLVGVNHRDLRTFSIDMSLTATIAPMLPADAVIVAESGVRAAADLVLLGSVGAHAVLVGERLMRAESPGAALRELRMTRIKICGVTRVEDAACAVAAGADFVGINFWPRSKRYVPADRAPLLVTAAREAGPVQIAGVFVDTTVEAVVAVLDQVDLDIVQLHGDESAELALAIARATGRPVWKALPATAADRIAEYADAGAILLDTPTPERGGSGRTFDWTIAQAACRDHPARRFVLAGGLRPDNVVAAIAEVAPWAVDVASGVDREPGIKDPAKIADLVAAVRSTTS